MDDDLQLWVARVAEGFVFGGLGPFAVETLKAVPMLLESNDPRVRERLLPETCDDADDEAHWREHAVPELERLFASRTTLVRRDLGGLRQVTGETGQALLIPHGHTNAWLAALNAARLALYALNDLTAAQMAGQDGAPAPTEKQAQALLRIHLLAEVQAVLLGDYQIGDAGTLADLPLE